MNIHEFNFIVNEMEKYYCKKLEDEQSKIYFKQLSFLSVERFKQIVDEIYKNNKFMPKVADIIDIDKKLSKPEMTILKVDCKECNGSGIVMYSQKDEESDYMYEYGARCACRNNRNWSIEIPLISQVMPI